MGKVAGRGNLGGTSFSIGKVDKSCHSQLPPLLEEEVGAGGVSE